MCKNSIIQTTFYLPKWLKEKRKIFAERLGLSENAFTRMAVSEKIERMKENNEEHF